MTLQTANVRQIHQLLATHGQAGWVEIVRLYGKNFFYQGNLVTCDPLVVEKLLTQRVHTRQRARLYKWTARYYPGAAGPLFLDGEAWEQQMRALMPTLRHGHVDGFAQTIQQTASAYTANWAVETKVADLFTTLTELGMQVVLQVGYGLDPTDSLAQQLGQELIGYKFATMQTRWRLDEFGFAWWKAWKLPLAVLISLDLRRRMQRIQRIVAALLARSARTGSDLNWLAGLAATGLPLPALTDAVNHLYGAFNTVDFTLTGAFYTLSQQPAWVQILRDEFASVLGTQAVPTHADFARLPQTMNFMREIFRTYPAATVVGRCLGEALEVEGTVVPAQSDAWILLYGLHHHPDYWENPDHFDPTRWAQVPSPAEPYAYIPFLTGPRHCVGRHLAELHFVVVLHTLLRDYEIFVQTPAAAIPPYFVPRFRDKLPALVRRHPVGNDDDNVKVNDRAAV